MCALAAAAEKGAVLIIAKQVSAGCRHSFDVYLPELVELLAESVCSVQKICIKSAICGRKAEFNLVSLFRLAHLTS